MLKNTGIFGLRSNLIPLHYFLMQSDTVPSRAKSIRKWPKVSKRIPSLYQHRPTGMYHARVR